MSQDFVGRTAIVTGAGSGIGRAVALALGVQGANVVVNDIDADAARECADVITDEGGVALAVTGDVSKPADVAATVAAAVSGYGALHLAFNNAGVSGPLGPLADIGVDEYLASMDVNLHSVFYGMRSQIPEIVKAGGGAIVNCSSVLGLVGDANAVAYVTAKHGIAGMTKSAALGYAAQGVRVNSVHPGYVETSLLGDLGGGVYDVLAALHPIGRLGTAEEVAGLVVFLLSDAAAFITGAQYAIDGGYTAI